MDAWKRLDQVLVPDLRNEGLQIYDEHAGGFRAATLADEYKAIERISLHSGVPEEIRAQFDVCRSLLLYSWFAYRFATVAELLGYATIEFALRAKIETINPALKKSGLRDLLKFAVSRGLIHDSGFRIHREVEKRREASRRIGLQIRQPAEVPVEKSVKEYREILIDTLPRLRNELAHGSRTIVMPGCAYRLLEIAADLINQLFPGRKD